MPPPRYNAAAVFHWTKGGTEMSTLFERIGGEAAVDAAVDLFYNKVLADVRIQHFFEGVDMEQQARHQKRFLTYAMGGLPDYPGRTLRQAHRRLVEEMDLGDQHFDAVMENLSAALRELEIPAELVTEVAALVESTRDDVLNR